MKPRQKPGRKPINPAIKFVSKGISLSPRHVRIAIRVGGGIASNGVQFALEKLAIAEDDTPT